MIISTDLLYKPMPRRGDTSNHFSEGGPVKTTMQEVHVNPEEVHHLDFLQGGPKFTSAGKRSYRALGGLFKNPHIVNAFHEHVAEHRANGGAIGRHEHASAANGRFGDTEVVEMPHHLVDIMNHAQGGATYNPWDGKPEYFLGGLFSSFANKIGPMLGSLVKGAGSLFSKGSGAVSKGIGSIGRGAASLAKATGRGIGRAASAATSLLPSGQNRPQPGIMQPQAPERPPVMESLPNDLYGGMAPSRQLSAARRVTSGIRQQPPAMQHMQFAPSDMRRR